MRGGFSNKLCRVAVLAAAGIFFVDGCAKHDYKEEADKQVYGIIDQKWQPGFGEKVNYKTGDTSPSPNDVRVERAVPSSGVLKLADAVAMATAYNREYRNQKDALYLKGLDLTLARHEFENQFFGGGGSEYSRKGPDEGVGAQANVGFNRLLADGAKISTNIAAAWANILTGNLRSGLTSVLTVTVTQPLLRGSGRAVVQENLTQAERDTLYQVRAFNHFRKIFVVDVISQYYRVLQMSDAVRHAEENERTIAELYERTKDLTDVGRLPLLEVGRVAQEKLQAQDVLVQAQKQYKQALDEFKITVSLPTDAEFRLDATELEALKAAMGKPVDFSEAEGIETALAQRLDMANSADAVTDAERKVVVAANMLKADLNLFGVIRPVSAERGNVSLQKKWEDFFQLGGELNLPLDRLAERNILRQTLITFGRSERQYELNVDTVKLEVRNAYRNLKEARQRYYLQAEGVELARKRLETDSLLVQYGRAGSRQVLRAQKDLFDAENAASQTLVDYTIASLSFYRDTGVLTVRNDGMWNH